MVTTRSMAASPPPKRAPASSAPHGEHEFEFGGPLGALGVMLGLPVVCYVLTLACAPEGCPVVAWPPVLTVPSLSDAASFEGAAVFLNWWCGLAALHMVLPGLRREGVELRGGGRLTYKLNGLAVMAVSLAAVAGGHWCGYVDLVQVHDHAAEVLTAAVAFSFALSAYLYAASFAAERRRGKDALAIGGNTGNAVYDFFIGRELNPRVGRLDLKHFNELYPGLIGWMVLNFAAAAKQHREFGSVSPAMGLVLAFELLYVADALWFEPAILTTMDITTDGFGFMLAFGDLAWVPFTYCVQARYLATRPAAGGPWFLAAAIALKVAGYVLFRGANSQKDAFRRDPQSPAVRHLDYLKTERGTRLIVSGYWGMSRHINYFGDWLMGLAWCLPCGLADPFPYFYAAYFGVLLVHREGRDSEACKKKYGKDWDKYCAKVPWRIVPYVY